MSPMKRLTVHILRAKAWLSRHTAPARAWLRRRLSIRTALSAVTAGGLMTFAFNLLGIQQTVCGAGPVQPWLADGCGALGLGGMPTRKERLAVEALPAGSCDALREHIRRFPRGAHHGEAADLIQARGVHPSPDWTPIKFELDASYVRQSPNPFPAEEQAFKDAQQRAILDAREGGCRARDEFHKLVDVRLSYAGKDCRQNRGGYICGLNYRAICSMLEQKAVETCGELKPRS